ncbi:hypothetical protein HMPREF1013_03112 [Bacillus sp. 2_A_57_CT2]|nr:hypothetical protein HMPREF1013_03112 [Bacillus sp. 2_A_57_CT2]
MDLMDYQNIGERTKRLNPIWHLGRGMDLGPELNPYREPICLRILLEIFQREVRDNGNRTIPNLEEIADSCIRQLKLQTDKEKNERLIEGLIWSGNPVYLSSFQAPFFNETTKEWEEHSFRYLEEDMEFSVPEEQYYVYKLSEESYEIIFMSHEILDELDIPIQSWVALQLIKKKNYRDALDRLQQLIIRVRKLIRKEAEYAENLKRNPKIINQLPFESGEEHKEKVQQQFTEEKKRYLEMEKLLSRLEDNPEVEVEIYILLDKINETREQHDLLAQLVIENVKTEIDIRKNHFEHLWKRPRISFKEAIWEELILQKGFKNPDDMFLLLNKIVSPKKPFKYPLDWSIEQEVTLPAIDIDDEDEPVVDEDSLHEPPLDFKPIVLLWKPVFQKLLQYGEVHLNTILEGEETKEEWLNQKYAVELWNQFVNSKLKVSKEDLLNSTDQRVRLIRELIHEDDVFEDLLNKEIITHFDMNDLLTFYLKDERGLKITNYRIELKEA